LKRLVKLQIAEAQVRDFLNASAGVEHGGKQGIVTGALSCGPVDSLEDRIDLLVLQIIDDSMPSTFKWNAEDPLREFQVLGIPGCDEVEERMYGRKSDVARRHTIFSFLFQIGEERQYTGRIDVNQIELRDSLPAVVGKKAE